MKRQFLAFDFLLVLLVFSVIIFGIVVIGSATHITIDGPSHDYEAQKVWFLTGIVLMLFAAFIDYHFISKFYIFAYLLSTALLVLVLFVGKSEGENVARWFRFGGVSLQPSEFTKIFMIVFLAKFIDKKNDKINNIFVLLFIVCSVLLPVALIMKQPSLSASLVIVAVFVVIIFAANISYKYIFATFIIIVPLAVFLYIDLNSSPHIIVDKFLTDYQITQRILPFFNPDPSNPYYEQTNKSIHAIGSGLLSGKGLYDGNLNRLNYVPYSHNDFIFSVIGEEFGFVGCVAVLVVMLLIILKCLLTAHKAADINGKLLCVGVAGMLFFQTFVNIGVATGALPNTGMTLPFISYGGSSLWINMIAIGLVLNVGMSKSKSFFEG